MSSELKIILSTMNRNGRQLKIKTRKLEKKFLLRCVKVVVSSVCHLCELCAFGGMCLFIWSQLALHIAGDFSTCWIALTKF